MEQSRSQAEVSVAQATAAGRSLDSIHRAVSAIHDMSTQIASAAEEQSSVAEEINRNVINISQIVEQTAGGVTQTTEAGERLSVLAGQLQAVLQRFRLPGDRAIPRTCRKSQIGRLGKVQTLRGAEL